ncbi:spidroin-1-like [Mustela putorius furo]|uniref:Spidroin-1-like n=1 Tax=Mustela putorius furo TaxID=9669 RepID=A0A8U0P048_MUSPF|nr:spidroin-1-like [Mustela putorius furo]
MECKRIRQVNSVRILLLQLCCEALGKLFKLATSSLIRAAGHRAAGPPLRGPSAGEARGRQARPTVGGLRSPAPHREVSAAARPPDASGSASPGRACSAAERQGRGGSGAGLRAAAARGGGRGLGGEAGFGGGCFHPGGSAGLWTGAGRHAGVSCSRKGRSRLEVARRAGAERAVG